MQLLKLQNLIPIDISRSETFGIRVMRGGQSPCVRTISGHIAVIEIWSEEKEEILDEEQS